MKKIVKNRLLTISSILMASSFWFFDSFVHYFIYGEPKFEIVPANFNELWMRLVIISLMILFGIFADYFTNYIASKDKLLELTCVYNDLLHINVDVLNNQVEQMKLFKMEAQKSKDFDPKIIDLYDNAMSEIADLVASLTKVVDVTDSQIDEEVQSQKGLWNNRERYSRKAFENN